MLFEFRSPALGKNVTVLGHLGMTGKMFVARKSEALPKHAAVVLGLSTGNFVFEDTRYFGRMTLDLSSVEKLGPEPWDRELSPEVFAGELKRSRQAIKVKLLDQSLLAGVGNIYASEALFRARISPRLPANRLKFAQVEKAAGRDPRCPVRSHRERQHRSAEFRSWKNRRAVLFWQRIRGVPDFYTERLLVYDRAKKPCMFVAVPRSSGSCRRRGAHSSAKNVKKGDE